MTHEENQRAAEKRIAQISKKATEDASVVLHSNRLLARPGFRLSTEDIALLQRRFEIYASHPDTWATNQLAAIGLRLLQEIEGR